MQKQQQQQHRCPCCCTCTVRGSLGASCGTSSQKVPPAPRLWSCTLDVCQHGQSAVWATPQLGSCASSGRGSATGHPPLPRLIELVASKVADFTALNHSGALPALAQQFCVVAPQTASGWPAARVHAFMRFLLAAESPLPCRIDPSRCFVTGHSMGGSGALVS